MLPFFPNSPSENSSYFEPLRFLWTCSAIAQQPQPMSQSNIDFQLTNQIASHVSLKCHKAYEFIEKLFPSDLIAIQQDQLANFIKSELFSTFASLVIICLKSNF